MKVPQINYHWHSQSIYSSLGIFFVLITVLTGQSCISSQGYYVCNNQDISTDCTGSRLKSIDTNKTALTTSKTSAATLLSSSVNKRPTPVIKNEKSSALASQNQDIEYTTQMGDHLPVLLKRFNVTSNEIKSQNTLPQEGLIEPGEILIIPNRFTGTSPSAKLLPDSEIVFSPSAIDFDILQYLEDSGGFLSDYWEARGDSFISGAQIIQIAAVEYSINPRIILALIEQQSHLVSNEPNQKEDVDFLLGWDATRKGFSRQIDYAIRILSTGYYSWREGSLDTLTFPDGSTLAVSPTLNAGTAALQYYFSRQVNQDEWYNKLYGEGNIAQIVEEMFGDAWQREQAYPPLIPSNLVQPEMVLPFQVDIPWNFTAGPHSVWNWYGANGALDFAPSGVFGCSISHEWVTASAPGVVIRTEKGFLAVDLDENGNENIGWTIIYMHVHNDFPLKVGDVIEVDDLLGHPSCDGGRATGAHVHIARKFNGEWILADGAIPFNLSGWIAKKGENLYEGKLVRGNDVIISSNYGEGTSSIIRFP